MGQELEAPAGDRADWPVLYLARGFDEVVAHRPVFTGDVFEKVPVLAPRATEPKNKTVMVIQHPCAMRPNGTNLAKSLLVAEVRRHPEVPPDRWTGYGKLMPLPDLYPQYESGRRHAGAFFDHTHHVHPDDLTDRVACLSLPGMNILMQRWVYHSARVVVPTFTYDEVTSPVFEEADIIEEWCERAMDAGRTLEGALLDVDAWLGEDIGGLSRREALKDRQRRSRIRRDLRTDAVTWTAGGSQVARGA